MISDASPPIDTCNGRVPRDSFCEMNHESILHISIEDVAVTREIVQAGKILDIDVMDHLIIGGPQKFVSLKERGLGFS